MCGAVVPGSAGGVEHCVQALEQLPPVRQVCERVVLGQVPELQRALLDAVFEVGLVGLDGTFGIRELIGHVVECVGEFVELAGASACDTRGEVAGGQASRTGGEPAHRPRDGPPSAEQREQREQRSPCRSRS